MKSKNDNKNQEVYFEYSDFLSLAKKLVSDNDDYYLVYSDISDCQSFNSIYGYENGEKILVSLCSDLMAELGATICGRIYSDHFVYLLPKDAGEKYHNKVDKDRFNEHLEELIVSKYSEFKQYGIFILCGISKICDKNIIEAVDRANFCRRIAKKAERSCIVNFDPSDYKDIAIKKFSTASVNRIIDRDKFIVYYQPIVNPQTGSVAFFEALSRGLSKGGRIVKPDEYIDAMEDNGSIIELDFFVIEEVCEKIHKNMQIHDCIVPVCINLSRVHIRNHNSVKRIEEIIQKYSIPTNLIVFELTENIFIKDYNEARRFIENLHELGFKVSMDDFGSRYSSVNDLLNLPFDYLKIDKAIIKDEDSLNDRTKSIIKTFTDTAKNIGIEIICEGVETTEQCEFLREIGLVYYQGYYFSKPLKYKDAKNLISEKKQFNLFKKTKKQVKFENHDFEEEKSILRNETKDNLGIGFWNYNPKNNLIFLPDAESIAGVNMNHKTYISADNFYKQNLIHPLSIKELKKLMFNKSIGNKKECTIYAYTTERKYVRYRISGMWTEKNGEKLFVGSYERLPEPIDKNEIKKKKLKKKLKEQSIKDETKLGASFGTTIVIIVAGLTFLIALNYHDMLRIMNESNITVSRVSNYNLLTGLVICLYLIIGFIILLKIFDKQTRKIYSEKERYNILSEFTDTALFEYNLVDDTLKFTQNAPNIIGLESTEFSNFSKNISKFCFSNEDRFKIENMIQNINDVDIGEFETRLYHPNGEKFWSSCQYKSIRENGQVVSIIGKINDIDEKKKREEKIISESNYDFTTNLQNKASIQSIINEELKKNSATGFIYMMDIDNFKNINDNYGHIKGDEALSKFSDILISIFGSNKYAGRIGGDEFIAYLSDEIDYSVAEKKAKEILSMLQKSSNEMGVDMTVSIGIVAYPSSSTEFFKLYELADKAMYRAKQLGKNQYCFSN